MNTLGTEIQEQYLDNMKGIQIYHGDCLEKNERHSRRLY